MVDKKRCAFAGHIYSHDAEICLIDKCIQCKDGEWEDKDVSVCCWDGPFRR